jgi:hypothetical protein
MPGFANSGVWEQGDLLVPGAQVPQGAIHGVSADTVEVPFIVAGLRFVGVIKHLEFLVPRQIR